MGTLIIYFIILLANLTFAIKQIGYLWQLNWLAVVIQLFGLFIIDWPNLA